MPPSGPSPGAVSGIVSSPSVGQPGRVAADGDHRGRSRREQRAPGEHDHWLAVDLDERLVAAHPRRAATREDGPG